MVDVFGCKMTRIKNSFIRSLKRTFNGLAGNKFCSQIVSYLLNYIARRDEEISLISNKMNVNKINILPFCHYFLGQKVND